jgi:branched-chain amino acid transport system permease protein
MSMRRCREPAHDLDFVREISSRVVVLHQGRTTLDGAVAEVVGSKLIRGIYGGPSRGDDTAQHFAM